MLEAIIAYRAARRRVNEAYDIVERLSSKMREATAAFAAATTDHQVAVRAREKAERELIAALDKSE